MADPFLGQIMIFGGNFTPYGWAFCQGQLLNISQYSALYALLGTMYGGNGSTTFGLPDLRSRVAIGFGQGPGLSNYVQGQLGGMETVTLNINQMPSHNHTFNPTGSTVNVQAGNGFGTTATPTGNYLTNAGDPSGQ